MDDFKYPKYLPNKPSTVIFSQYWEDPHSIIVKEGSNGYKSSDNGSASLGKQYSSVVGVVVCVFAVVLETVECPISTHSLEYECSYLYLMIKGIFHW